MDMPVDFRGFDVPAIERRAAASDLAVTPPIWRDDRGVPFFVRIARPFAPSREASPEPMADEPIGRRAYEDVVARVRERIAREVPPLPDFRVALLDGAAAGGPVGDAARTFGRSNVATRTFARYLSATATSGGFTSFVSAGNGRYVCATTGGPPALTMYNLVGASYPGPMTFGAATARDFQEWIHWHEVGHCLLGSSEMRADTFGLLMAIQSGVSKDMVRSVAAFRESAELTSPYRLDDYVVSPASDWVAARFDAFRSDREFEGLDVVGVARLATALADRLAPSEREVAERGAVRASLVAALTAPRIDGRDGGREVDGLQWLYLHARDVAVFARVADVHARLSGGPRDPSPFDWDYALYRSQVGALAATGDATAKVVLSSLDDGIEARVKPRTGSPYGFEPAKAMADRFMPPASTPREASMRERREGRPAVASRVVEAR